MSSNRNSARARAWRGANLRLAGALVSVVVVLLAVGGVAQAQDKTLYWQRYDVDLTVLQNGDLRAIRNQRGGFSRQVHFNSASARYSDLTSWTASAM